MKDQMRRLQADIIVKYMLVVIVIVIVIGMKDQMRRLQENIIVEEYVLNFADI